jgi:prepilin-type N-terminal cleavage/methylation domain-containing protein
MKHSLIARRRGVTLIEMMIVVAIIGLMAGISFPAVTSGLDGIRLHNAADSVAAFLNSAMDRVNRRQDVIEVVIDPKQNQLALFSTEPGYTRTLELPRGVTIAGDAERRYMLMPGASFPRFAVDLVNGRATRKRIAVDPITGSPQISTLDNVAE